MQHYLHFYNQEGPRMSDHPITTLRDITHLFVVDDAEPIADHHGHLIRPDRVEVVQFAESADIKVSASGPLVDVDGHDRIERSSMTWWAIGTGRSVYPAGPQPPLSDAPLWVRELDPL